MCDKCGLFWGSNVDLTFENLNHCIDQINLIKEKSPDYLIRKPKRFDKIKQIFMEENFSKPEMEGNFLNLKRISINI